MKIAYVTFLYEAELGGGAAQVVYSLAHAMAVRGHEVSVITSAPVKHVTYETLDGIRVIRFFPKNLYWVFEKDKQPPLKKILWQLMDVWNPFAYSAVKGYLRDAKPDLVHVHKLRGLSPSAWTAAKAAGVPKLVHTCHDYELISPEGQLSTQIGRLAARRVFPMRVYQVIRAGFSRQVERISGPSQFVLETHRQMGFFPKAKFRVIPNTHGVDEPNYSLTRRQEFQEHRPLRLLYLGRIVPEKGVEILCDAVKKCSQVLPDIGLDVVGWGFLEQKLRETFGNVLNIAFHDAAFGAEKEKFLNNCDLLVVPSLYPESFGIVIAEALAHGKPVLASRIGAIPELIEEGKTGFLFSPGDIDELESRINQIASEPEKLYSMRNDCFDAAERFSPDAVQQQYQDLYDE